MSFQQLREEIEKHGRLLGCNAYDPANIYPTDPEETASEYREESQSWRPRRAPYKISRNRG